MSLRIYYQDIKVGNTCSIGLMSVETCSKAILAPALGYGKSPCFSGVGFLLVVGPAYLWLGLRYVDGRDFLECAF